MEDNQNTETKSIQRKIDLLKIQNSLQDTAFGQPIPNENNKIKLDLKKEIEFLNSKLNKNTEN